MHYCVLVLIPAEEPMEETVEEVLRPYRDKEFDWCQIGGRWTGLFDDYNPENDPALQKVCTYCAGTGDRKDLSPPEWKAECGGCDGCHGKGKSTVWPTEFPVREADMIPLADLTPERYAKFFAVCTPGAWHSSERYEPWAEEKFPKMSLPPLEWLKTEYPDYRAVIVDCHN